MAYLRSLLSVLSVIALFNQDHMAVDLSTYFICWLLHLMWLLFQHLLAEMWTQQSDPCHTEHLDIVRESDLVNYSTPDWSNVAAASTRDGRLWGDTHKIIINLSKMFAQFGCSPLNSWWIVILRFIIGSSNPHVLGLWEETGAPVGNSSRHVEGM